VLVEYSEGPNRAGNVTKAQTALLAAQTADRLLSLKEAGQDCSGMALLLGVTTNADLYIDALRSRGLECVVSGGSSFTKSDEAQVMLALLFYLANPHDTESGLFPVLSSPMFELEPADFLMLATRPQERVDAPTKRSIEAGLMSDVFWGSTHLSRRLKHARDVLRRARDNVSRMPVADVCFEVLRESGWLSRLEERGTESYAIQANLLAAVRYIRELTSELGLGPARAAKEFALWLKLAKVAPASLAGPETGAIQIMTVHASKGLEFDVVAVAEMWSKRRSSSGIVSWDTQDVDNREVVIVPRGVKPESSQEMPVTVNSNSSIVDWFVFLRDNDRLAEEEEKARLLYVALTRAREALVLALPVATKKDGFSEGLGADVRVALMGYEQAQAGISQLGCGHGCEAQLRTVVLSKTDVGLEADGAGCLNTCWEGVLPQDVWRTCIAAHSTYGETRNNSITLYELQRFDAENHIELADMREGSFSYSSVHDLVDSFADNKHSYDIPSSRIDCEFDDDPRISSVGDNDKATNLGSAFHQAAELMVRTAASLDTQRKDALVRQWELSERQKVRFESALARWERSALRAEVLKYETLMPEQSFFSRVDSRFGSYVEGAIDLLAQDASTGKTLVIDYKTGDRDLDIEQIFKKHEMQANFYAYVLMSSGIAQLTCIFVCVEREDDQGEPLAVRYTFDEEHPPHINW
ncbi:MAG: PD-(D/E)XK nuclease family protein, partial [Atopobiaceae bacterium]|nr:PD-(D/E)XK nuclease family protein [Atopobiaceae bacterium]